MSYIPHTVADIRAMLDAVGCRELNDLFDEIPADLRCGELQKIPPRLTEMEIGRLMRERAARDAGALCFIGAGAYEHHIPAAIWEIATRGEFYSAYTPYQAEASQGTLQLLYEFQSMMAGLTGMDASNASMYDGASALAEAVLMAVRLNRKVHAKKILMPRALHPAYRKVTHTIVKNQDIELIDIPYLADSGRIDMAALAQYEKAGDIAALVLAQPNFFGVLENVDELTAWAQAHEILVIGVVNPLSLAVFTPPGAWGGKGADIACGEGQPMGIPLSSGGPYFGFMCCKKAHVRQMPGRIIGRTVDMEGKPGFSLTLQAREQHIRRSKATSNICTNQGLMVTAATMYMALMGAEGLQRNAAACHRNAIQLRQKLTAIEGVKAVFDAPYFHETVLRLSIPVNDALRALAAHNILGGYDLSQDYPELGNALLVCATETRTQADMDKYAEHLQRIIHRAAPCPVSPKI
jgi:glycine dehydrogenase subunit 1